MRRDGGLVPRRDPDVALRPRAAVAALRALETETVGRTSRSCRRTPEKEKHQAHALSEDAPRPRGDAQDPPTGTAGPRSRPAGEASVAGRGAPPRRLAPGPTARNGSRCAAAASTHGGRVGVGRTPEGIRVEEGGARSAAAPMIADVAEAAANAPHRCWTPRRPSNRARAASRTPPWPRRCAPCTSSRVPSVRGAISSELVIRRRAVRLQVARRARGSATRGRTGRSASDRSRRTRG